jgi:hypothetical protein
MKNRFVQLGLVALVGAFLAWLLMRGDEPEPDLPRPAATEPAPAPAEPAVAQTAPSGSSPTVVFKLPKMGAPRDEVRLEQAKPPTTLQIPKDWLLRGSGSKNYELRSDKATAFTGNFSALLMAHDKDVSPNLSGSGIQAVLAAPYVGKRVELSAMLRGEGMRNAGSVWMYVTDPSRVIIAYQVAQMSATGDPGEWTRYRVVMDMPFHGEVLAYGFTLQGKGKLWVDDVHLRAVDDAVVPLTGPQNAHQVGVIAQAVSVDGALANPANLDFEDIQITRERQPPPPPDEIKGTRF